MRDLDPAEAAEILAGVTLNLIRRSAEGGLIMSTDHWLLASSDETAFTFAARPPAPESTEPIVVVLAEVDRITWDRLARQKARSQVRFHRRDGAMLTFSGQLPDPDNASAP
jgi:hypothetical protein